MKEFVRQVSFKDHRELYVQLIPEKGEEAAILAHRAGRLLGKPGIHIIRATFFGDLDARTGTLSCLEKEIKAIDFPCTWIEGGNCSESFINGACFFSVEGIEVTRIIADHSVKGSYYYTDEAGFLFLGDLCSPEELPHSVQTEELLHVVKKILSEAKMEPENIVRTWFYLDDILYWYNEFNDVRTSFYNNNGINEGTVPASTGIGGKNSRGSKLCLELNAIKPDNGFSIENVCSPLQCSAMSYGSSFSRAKIFGTKGRMNMTVSGTASIGKDGRTLHKDDIDGQLKLTFSVLTELLLSQGFDFKDVTRAYAYFKNKSMVSGFSDFIRKETGADIEFICTENSICRGDLLFEADIDVAKIQPVHLPEKIQLLP